MIIQDFREGGTRGAGHGGHWDDIKKSVAKQVIC